MQHLTTDRQVSTALGPASISTSSIDESIAIASITRLSDREREILKLLTEGLSNPKIAAMLSLSTNTVKTHVRGIFNKLAVDNRLQAAVVATRLGLLE
ncbi:MAG TPA: LuxR C-terminal-related transcriptional regulator [Crinalium sp.]|jgi:DNA-binding NarL/FixJ family response regulator